MKRNILVALALSIGASALAQTPTSPLLSSQPKLKLSGETGPVLTVPARIISSYGERTDPISGQAIFNSGTDLTAFSRAPIVAPVNGAVVFVGTKPNYGQTIDLDAGDGIVIRLAQLAQIAVEQGAQVHVGEKIGLMGSPERAGSPRLHLEVYSQGQPVDPASIANLTLIDDR